MFDPELLKEGDEIAKRFYQDPEKFNLEMEAFCKKIWKPWFDAGKWVLIDLTQPKSGEFQVEDKSWSPELKAKVREYLKTLRFPQVLRFPEDLNIGLGTSSLNPTQNRESG